MPLKYGSSEKCVICEKSVYANEKIEAGGRLHHKFCFKCSACKLQLNLNNYAQAEGILYCKNHFAELVTAKNTQAKVL